MEVAIDYGKTGLTVNVPGKNVVKVLSMTGVKPLPEIYIEITKSLLRPIGMKQSLFDMAKQRKNACILICDITRPVPNQLILPPILKTLHAAGMDYDDILILVATGIHRPNEGEELVELVGKDIAEKYHIENHFAGNLDDHRNLGKTSRGTDIWIDKRYLDAELKITTGFIEPHLMAGFSGGRKLIVPGIASIETMKVMHGPQLLSHPNSREGIIEGNPFHEEALEIARTAGVDFIMNVTLDEKKRISGIFAGDLEAAHSEGIHFVKQYVRDTIPEPVDIVITTSAGYPLDATYYQAIKGMTAAMPIVKDGGTIIIAAECSEGIGSEHFTRLVRENPDPDLFLQKLFSDDFFVIDQWQLQEYAKVAQKAEIILVSGGLSQEDKNSIHVQWKNTVREALDAAFEKHGSNARIAIIPKGPYILSEIE